MKKIISFLILFVVLSFAQDKTTSVELPDFVITGVQSVSIPLMKKNKMEMLSTLSKEYLLPEKTFNEVKIDLVKEINPPDTNINFIKRPYNGVLKLGVGNVSMPKGEFTYSTSSRFVMLDAKIWGRNDKNYIANSSYNSSGGKINTDFFISGSSGFLPGSQISANAGFFRDEYKLFGSSTAIALRKTNDAFGSLSFKNTFGEYNIGSTLKINSYKLDDQNFDEQKIELNGFVNFNINQFAINTKAKLIKQIINKSFSVNDGKSFINLGGIAKLKIANNLELKGGVDFYNGPNHTALYPTAYLNLKLNDNLSVFGYYKPEAEFYSIQDIVNVNRFFIPAGYDNLMTRTYINFGGLLKYSFDKYVEIGAGFKIAKSDNELYFEDVLGKGDYTMNTANSTSINDFFVDAVFHKGPYGFLTANLTFNQTKFDNGKYIPFKPQFKGRVSYYYEYLNYHFGAGLKFAGSSYSDKLNTDKLDSYIDLSFNLKYELLKNFRLTLDIENLLNKKNYIFKGYQEKTFDIIFGIDFKW